MPQHGNKFCLQLARLLEQRSREMTVIPVYPATHLRLELFSEGTDSIVDSERGFEYMDVYMYASAVFHTVDEHSYP